MAKDHCSANDNKEQKPFFAKLDDLVDRSDYGVVGGTGFLTPGEQYKAEKYFLIKGLEERICFFGGYFAAERKQIFLFPEYLSEHCGYVSPEEMIAEEYSSIKAVKIEGSGYRKLTHRDYLGSMLSLGIKRWALGDICILNDHSALVFCIEEMEKLLLSDLSDIANDKVKVIRAEVDKNMSSAVRLEGHSDTVASERLDCVVAAICNLSRENAQGLIKGGLVDRNYDQDLFPDSSVSEEDVISVRGYGKFIIREISERTKKGRIRLIFDKYI